jgi:hypothetical protein
VIHKPRDFLVRWHSFIDRVKDDATVFFVGESTTAVTHTCKGEVSKLVRRGAAPAFFGMAPEGTAGKIIKLEKPMEIAPRAGYCEFCNILWIGQDSDACLTKLQPQSKP